MKNTEFNKFIDKKFDELSNKRKTLLAKLNTQKLFMIALIFFAVGIFFLATFILFKNIPPEILSQEDISFQNYGLYLLVPFFAIAFGLSVISCIFALAKPKDEKTKSTLRRFYAGYKKSVNLKEDISFTKQEKENRLNITTQLCKILLIIIIAIYSYLALNFIIDIIDPNLFETVTENVEQIKYARGFFGIILFSLSTIVIPSCLYLVKEHKTKTDEEKLGLLNIHKVSKKLNKQ